MRYYIIEIQHRADGDFNFIKTEKYSEQTALAYYYTRKAAYIVDTTYPLAAIQLLTSDCQIVEMDLVTTSYVAPDTLEEKETNE